MRTHKCRCLFVPPHVLESIARSGREEVRESARLSIQQSNLIRQHRQEVARNKFQGMLQAQQGLAPPAGQANREVWDCQHQQELRVPPRARGEGEPPTKSGAMRKEKSGVDDGWRIPDALWVRIEPLLPAKTPTQRGAAPGQQTARPWTVSSTSYGLAANGKPCRGNSVHPARSMTAISVGDKLGFSRACGRLDCWSMTP